MRGGYKCMRGCNKHLPMLKIWQIYHKKRINIFSLTTNMIFHQRKILKKKKKNMTMDD